MIVKVPLTGIASIDSDHTEMLLYIEKVRSTPNPMSKTLVVLLGYVEKHIKKEEALISTTHYPQAIEHVLEHRKLTSALKSMIERNSLNPSEESEAIMSAILAKFLNHIIIEDRNFADWYLENERRYSR